MELTPALKRVFLFIGLFLFSLRAPAQEIDPDGAVLLQKMTDAYKGASSFSSQGHYEDDLQTATPLKLMGSFKILFGRPDQIRVDWTETKMGGEVDTNSVFTRDKAIFFYWELMHKWAPQKDIESALGMAAGISHGVSYLIPALLRQKPGVLKFTTLKPPGHAPVNGKDCLVLAGTTQFQGDLELTIDPDTLVIRQLKTTRVIRHGDLQKQMEKARADAAKSNPELAARMHDIPAVPDFTSVNVMTFDDPAFNPPLAPADFDYPVPATAKKVDDVLK